MTEFVVVTDFDMPDFELVEEAVVEESGVQPV